MTTREEVIAIPTPEATKTWSPAPHGQILEVLDNALAVQGIGVQSERYTVTKDGGNLFGTWLTDIEMDGSYVQIGFRNSHKKQFAVGVCSGTHVIVCSNLMFDGTFLEFRKHTSKLNREELEVLAEESTIKVVEESKRLHDWHNNLRELPMYEYDRKVLTFDAMEKGILPPSKFKAFADSYWEEVETAKGEQTLYQFHGATTRLMRKDSLFNISRRTPLLNQLCDNYRELVAA